MSSFCKNLNKNVSSNALSNADCKEISLLAVVSDKKSAYRNASVAVWNYFGNFCHREGCSTSATNCLDNKY